MPDRMHRLLHDLGDRRSRCHFHERAQALARVTAGRSAAGRLAVDRDRAADPGGRRGEQDLRRRPSSGARPARVSLRDVARRDAGAGRRIGKRQDHAGAPAARPRLARSRRSRSNWTASRSPARAAARRADQLKALQIVFQNPDSALNRSHSVRRLIGRALARLGRVPRPERPARLLRIDSIGAPRGPHSRSAPASAVGRIETARCDRARVCGGPSHRGLR